MNINYLDFLEIGACIGTGEKYQKLTKEYNHDFIFMTSIADRVPDGVYGFSIEPIKEYLDNLNAPPTVNKLNCAISNHNSEADIFYVSIDDAFKYNLYSWVVGCASLYKVNERLWKYLSERKLCHILKKHTTKTITIPNIIELYNINSIEYLKIDTEGQDYDIILSILNGNKTISVDKIQFESYQRSEKLNIIKNILLNNNYVELYSGHDTFMINRNSLSRLLCYPNLLDQIFLQDLKYNLDIKDF
jgi:FkbM family methyltransferase